MGRTAILLLTVMVLAACTAPEDPPASEPVVERYFVGGPPDTIDTFSDAVEPHGIRCGSFEGKTMGSPNSGYWRTTCRATEREWARAEPTLARLAAEGIARQPGND